MVPAASAMRVERSEDDDDTPSPSRALPYGLHTIDDDDVAAVVAALRSDLLAQGPRVAAFEAALGAATEAPHVVACSSGSAALHLALAALGVAAGDVCIAPDITFLATATAARLCGAEVVFADVDPLTGSMTPASLREALRRAGRRAKVAIPVHLGGRLCDMAGLQEVAQAFGVVLVEDSCHALGSVGPDGPAGAARRSAAATFSFHPVKTIACGEGGAVTTRDPDLAARMRRLRNHGVTRDVAEMTDADLSLDTDGAVNPWAYEQLELGFNYRMTDVEAALGLSQLKKLHRFAAARRELSMLYDALLAPLAPRVRPVATPRGQTPCPHLYVAHFDFPALGVDRPTLMRRLAARGVGAQVHYIPLHRQPYFARRYGPQRLDGADAYYAGVLALPLFPAMGAADVQRVVLTLASALGTRARVEE